MSFDLDALEKITEQARELQAIASRPSTVP